MPEKLGYNVHKHNPYRRLTGKSCGRMYKTGGFAMLKQLLADTNVIYYLMAVLGVMGVAAKIVNHLTLRRLLKAAGNMPKSTHKLIKLVRAKYEHACMIHDSVENIEGASAEYLSYGFVESVYQYIATGAAGVVLLSVIIRLSDEPYKINAVKMYMIDYLENICALRMKKQRQTDREEISVIAGEAPQKPVFQNASQAAERETKREERQLSIHIEGEPRTPDKSEGEPIPQRSAVRQKTEDEDKPVLREEAIRQILEEFLA